MKMNKRFGGISEKLSTVPKKGGVVVGNIKTEKSFINANGDEVVPFTHQVIKKNVEEKLIIN